MKRNICLLMLIIISSTVQAREIPTNLWELKMTESRGFAKAHNQTPVQPEGPFFPVEFPDETDRDLTSVEGRRASGTIVYVEGKVQDTSGNPLKNAAVEIWQAGQSGSYNHPEDTNTAPRDPNFQYYALAHTDINGYYLFKTIIPGPYPATDSWMRPPHIHYKVSHPEHKTLITQLYFDGNSFLNEVISTVGGREVTGAMVNSLNELDPLLARVKEEKRSELVVQLDQFDALNAKMGTFDLYLERDNHSEL